MERRALGCCRVANWRTAIAGQVFALTWHAGDTAEQRTWPIDHWHGVPDELRRRGWSAEGGVDRSEKDSEH
jgi:hypothetical protein